MATLKSPANFLHQIKTALVDTRKNNGIPAKIQISPVPITKLCRIAVIAPKFKQMKQTEHQRPVWRIVENTFPMKDQMQISMIITLPDKEASGK